MTYLWVTLSFLIIYSLAATYFCIKFALTVLRVQDAIEEGIQTIDEKHQSISEILQRPLFYDSLEVRQVLKDIEETQQSLHQIAYDLSSKLVEEREEP